MTCVQGGGKTLELYKTYKICGSMKLMEHYGPIFKTSGTIFKPVEHEELYINPEELCTFFFSGNNQCRT